MKLKNLIEAKYYSGNKIPVEIAKQLVVIPMPPTLDLEAWYDYDMHNGYGGADSIVFENPRVLVTDQNQADGYAELLEKADAYFRD